MKYSEKEQKDTPLRCTKMKCNQHHSVSGGGCPRAKCHKSEILQFVSSSDIFCFSIDSKDQYLGGKTSSIGMNTYVLKVENSPNGVVKRSILGGGKLLSISMIRFLAMLSIIACHFCQYYDSEWAWWLNVGVQVFFIISGFLYGNKIINEPIPWLKKQFVKILIPYYIFLTLAIVGYKIVSPDRLGLTNIISSYFVVGTIKGINHLWFVSYILSCYIITPYLAAIRDYLSNKNILYAISSIVVIVGMYSIIEILINGHFRPGMVGCYILGYYTAVFVNRLGGKILHVCFWLSLVPTVISNYVYCHFHYIQGLEMKGMLVHITDYSHAFLGYSITMLLMIIFKKMKENKILEYSDRYSYEIYLVHQLFILSPLTLLTFCQCRIINTTITLIAIFVSGVILYYMDKAIQKKL